jgi:syntaxin 1B/2/3
MPTGRYDAGYRPPVPPSPTYQTGSRGDRHAESKETYEMSQRTTPVGDGIVTTDQFFQEVEEVKDLNKKILNNITLIEELHGSALSNINEEQTEENSFRLEKAVKQTTKLNNQCKTKIKGKYLIKKIKNSSNEY